MSAAVASSALAVPHSRIRELADIAMKMDGVYKLYFGESNVPTPEFIKRAAQEAMEASYKFYTSNAGLPSLRGAIGRYYRDLHNVDLDPDSEIVVSGSGVQALSTVIRCMLDPGDEVIVLTPAWPNGAANIMMANATPRQVPHILCGGRYAVDFDALDRAVTPRTRGLLYISPSNPLGWVATEQEQQELLDFARRHSLWLIADEVYERIYFRTAEAATAKPAPSILRKCTRADAVAVIQSFSKAYCMTGWRLGWIAGRKDLIAQAAQLNEFIISCAAGFTQRAGEAALQCGENSVRDLVTRLRENRDYCLGVLSKVNGVAVTVPDGAFYLFARIEGVTDSFDFCKRLLLETKVGLAPGVAFGEGGEGHVRICFASDRPILEEAMARLKSVLESR